MDSLIYQDNTHKDIWLKVVLIIPLVLILLPAFYHLATSDTGVAVEMFGPAALILVIFWIIIPRRYLIFDSKVTIVFGKPFSFSIPFDKIKAARILKGTSFGINFPSSLSSKHAVEIVRLKRMNVTITPDNPKLFLENLDKALNEWQQRHGKGTQ